ARRPPPRSRRLCGGADHVAAAGAAQLLDRGEHDRGGGPYRHAVPRARAELRRVGIRADEPPAMDAAARPPAGFALPQRRRAAGAAAVPARHGARERAAEPAVEPGAGAHLRGRMGQGASIARRAVLAAGIGAPWAIGALAGCTRGDARGYDGAWLGASPTRGHRVRAGETVSAATQQRADVVIIGGGIAGLACARTLARRGIDDVVLLELEDTV